MTAKNPSATWYFIDWENAPELKTCTLAAQGLWMRLLCIAARSPEPGIVQIEGRDSGLPQGLTHIASAVGRPPEEIAPLIDELLTSGTASRDRKGRIYCRRMKRKASVSVKRSKAGKLGAEATHGKERKKEALPRQTPWQTAGPSRLPDFESSSQEVTPDIAARASASPDGPPRPRLPDSAVWAERLDQFRPWLPHDQRGRWEARWGLRPDSPGSNALIPPLQLASWRLLYTAKMREAMAA